MQKMEIQKNDSAKVEIQSCEVCIFFFARGNILSTTSFRKEYP